MSKHEERDYSPHDVLTRAEFVLELLDAWENSLTIAEEKGYTAIARHLKSAIHTLKNSFAVHELITLDAYRDAIDELDKKGK